MKRAFPIAHCLFLLKGDIRDPQSRFAINNRQSAMRQWAIGNRPSTFIEVLFAVILLGIGFIMIAAVFPVAIQQTSAVSDETQGTASPATPSKKFRPPPTQNIGTPPTTPGTTNSIFQPTLVAANPTVAAFSPNTHASPRLRHFFTADRRFGWVGFYRRDSATSPFAQVFIIALQNPNFPNYMTRYAPGETTAINPAPPILPVVAPPIPPFLYNYATPSAFTAPTALPAAPTAGVQASITANFSYDAERRKSRPYSNRLRRRHVSQRRHRRIRPGRQHRRPCPSTWSADSSALEAFPRLPPPSQGRKPFISSQAMISPTPTCPPVHRNPYTFTATILRHRRRSNRSRPHTANSPAPSPAPTRTSASRSAFIRVNTTNN